MRGLLGCSCVCVCWSATSEPHSTDQWTSHCPFMVNNVLRSHRNDKLKWHSFKQLVTKDAFIFSVIRMNKVSQTTCFAQSELSLRLFLTPGLNLFSQFHSKAKKKHVSSSVVCSLLWNKSIRSVTGLKIRCSSGLSGAWRKMLTHIIPASKPQSHTDF